MKNLSALRILFCCLWLLHFSPEARAFVHPGLSHGQTDLDRMRDSVNFEPYKTVYKLYAGSGYSQFNNTGQGPFASVTYGSGNGQFEIRNDAQVAHQNAIMWYVTGDVRYRNNAINIINGWVNTMTSFDQTDLLTAGTAVLDFCNAAEILNTFSGGAWAATDVTKFQNWLITYFYPVLLSPGNSIAADTLGPAGFGGLQIKGLLSIGIFCERQDIYDFGVSSYLHNGQYSYGVLEYISPSGQNYETQRDVGHPSGNLSAIMESGYIIWNQGRDVFATSNNLIAKAYEVQAKFDLGWDLAPIPYTAPDGPVHSKVSNEGRTPIDNLNSDLAYRIFHDIKGLDLPFTKMSADYKFSSGNNNNAFYYRVDKSGVIPTAPFIGEPAATTVHLYDDGFAGSYITSSTPGNYRTATLQAAGMKTRSATTARVPIGWTVTAYDQDSYRGNSITLTGTVANQGMFDLSALGFNDKLASMKVVGGGTWPIFNDTYTLVNRSSGKYLTVSDASTANGATIVQNTYTGARNQLWRVEALSYGNGQYKLTNLNSGKVLEIGGASTAEAAPADQQDSAEAIGSLATGGTASASPAGSTDPAPAFDGDVNTKWLHSFSGSVAALQYQLPSAAVLTQYRITSANDVPDRDPKAWQFQGSNDATTWTTLDTKTAENFPNRFQTNIYNFATTGSYLYYRLYITANHGDPSVGVQLSELAFYSSQGGPDHQRWTFSPVTGATYGTYLSLTNANSGKVLEVANASTSEGAPVDQRTSLSALGLNQQWLLQIPSFVSMNALPPPTGLTAAAGDTKVTLSWSAASGASSYLVRRSSANEGYTYEIVGKTTGLSFVDTGRTNGVTYSYFVSTANAAGQSNNSSNEARATPLTPIMAWRQANFGTTEAIGDASNDADPDNDGRVNTLEYAIGSNPNSPDEDSPAQLGKTADDTKLTLTFNRIADPSVTYKVEATDDLKSTWTSIWSSSGSENVAGSVTIEDSETIAATPYRFLRLRVSLP